MRSQGCISERVDAWQSIVAKGLSTCPTSWIGGGSEEVGGRRGLMVGLGLILRRNCNTKIWQNHT